MKASQRAESADQERGGKYGRQPHHVTVFWLSLTPHTRLAECAWVLWSRDTHVVSRAPVVVEWDAPVAFADRGTCMAFLDRQVKKWQESHSVQQRAWLEDGGTAAVFSTHVEKDGILSESTKNALCLPDTVDPRGPKGK